MKKHSNSWWWLCHHIYGGGKMTPPRNKNAKAARIKRGVLPILLFLPKK